MKSRNVIAATIMGLASLGLTACDPPMPPEVAAALAEQTYTCVQGEAKMSSPSLFSDVAMSWADSLSYSCVDPEPAMTLSQVATPDGVDIEISDRAPMCSAKVTVPVAVDAAVLVFANSELSSINVSDKSLAGILDGSIKNWNQLQGDNPGVTISSLPIKLLTETDSQALKTVEGYLSSKKLDISKSTKLTASETLTPDNYSMLEEGAMAIVSNSFAVYLGLYPASIYQGMDSDGNPILATPDLSGIQSASTQWKFTAGDSGFTVAVDPSKAPIIPDGSEVAPIPYQMIYPVNLNLCNDNLVARAVSRFVLRLDSQGALGLSNYAPLPEAVRVSALVSVSKGLPTPSPAPTE